MSFRKGDKSKPIPFTVDHPFFFFIGSSTSTMPIFCGSVYRPTAADHTPPSKLTINRKSQIIRNIELCHESQSSTAQKKNVEDD